MLVFEEVYGRVAFKEKHHFLRKCAKLLDMGFAKGCVIFDGQTFGFLRQRGSNEIAPNASIRFGFVRSARSVLLANSKNLK